MTNRTKKYITVLSLLSLAPLLRELFFGIFSHHHTPFSSTADLIHTGTEMFFMTVLGMLLIYLDYRFTRKKDYELRLTQSIAIEALASLAEYRDAETAQHLQRISAFVKILAKNFKNNSTDSKYISTHRNYIDDLAHASVLHDIGKIAVPDGILLKPARLTNEEFELMKTHTSIGSEILATADNQFKKQIGKQSYLTLAQSVAKSHHEKWDGTGYPEGLTGDEIPLGARIVAICDVYDAVTSDRVYKKAWSHNEAVDLIKKGSGTHFDPNLAELFLKIEKQFERIKLDFV
ncbi:MAG: HD domain-containing protein [Desulfotalea sp.]